MPKTQAHFRLSSAVLAAMDDLAASAGDKTAALSEAVTYWHAALQQAGRRNADEFSLDEWSLLAHLGNPTDNLLYPSEDDDREWY